MKAIELTRAFDPRTFEDAVYKRWRESGAFKPGSGRGIHHSLSIMY